MQVPVAEEGDEGVDLGGWACGGGGPGEPVGLGQPFGEDVLELAGRAEGVFGPVG